MPSLVDDLKSLTHRKPAAKKGSPAHDKHKHWEYKTVAVIATIATVLQTGLLLISLFEPSLPYKIGKPPSEASDSEEFVRTLASLCGTHVEPHTKLEVLTNGEHFYAAELAAIRSAQSNIDMEAYIFADGDIAGQFVQAMKERANAGVHVNLLMDAVGSKKPSNDEFKELRAAGANVRSYNDLRWYTWPHYNNRTHRELLIVDGKVGFIGGAGVADHWFKPKDGKPRWRDTMVRVEGEAATGLQSTFTENWLESSGELLTGQEYFPFANAGGNITAMIVPSAPTTGRSTRARILFQTLLSSAKQKIYATTPYFLPDPSMRGEMIRAMKERHVELKILVPGTGTDHLLTRRSSRRLYGDLLANGAQIYEYGPTMIHAKILIIDGKWSVVGSTNLDYRSFGLNDEDNMAVLDAGFAARLEQDFNQDLAQSHLVSYQEWRSRPFYERFHEWLGGLIQREE